MIILSANDLTKTYGTDVIIDRASFHINDGDKVGIVGRNGAGKTTLLNLLTGELSPDGGQFFVPQNVRVGYLKQRDNFDAKGTVIEEIDKIFQPIHSLEGEIKQVTEQIEDGDTGERTLERLDRLQREFEDKGGYTYKSEIKGILKSMAFGEEFYNKPVETLSGGERTRLALAALLLEKPEILMLDEPTNHLDIGTLKWLEQYLAAYRGTILIVSHDRYFLDQTVNKIIDVTNKKVTLYDGNYTQYVEKKRHRREAELRAYNNQQREIARQEDMIRRMRERETELLAKRARSREKRLDMIDRLEKPEGEQGRMKLTFKQNFQSGGDVLHGENLEMAFGYGEKERRLFKGVSFDIKRGERVCIVGPNGVGKTTLLKMMMGDLTAKSGNLKIGHNVAFGYYDQGQLLLNTQNTVLEELKESYRLYTDTEMRNILGRFLFRGDDVFLKIGSLSGGEKARLSLLKMMLSGANTLILDEPTNHLDIESKEAFEDALLDFPGTMVIVSHDRYFLKKIPTRMLELHEDGVTEYLGKYDYYMEKKAQIESGKQYLSGMAAKGSGRGEKAVLGAGVQASPSGEASSTSSESGVSGTKNAGSLAQKSPEMQDANALRRAKKEREAEERRRERQLAEIEERILDLDGRKAQLEDEMARDEVMKDYQRLAELSAEHQNLEDELKKAYERWEELCS